jgi:hypothetical protein
MSNASFPSVNTKLATLRYVSADSRPGMPIVMNCPAHETGFIEPGLLLEA